LSGYNPGEGINILEEFEFDDIDSSMGLKELHFFQKSCQKKSANVLRLFRMLSW